MIYTTNAIESVNMSLLKSFFLPLRNISLKWSMPIRDWKAALTRFPIELGERISDI